MRTEARFPNLEPTTGHYESFYLKTADPAGGRALWIRHTIHKRPGAEPTCSIWFTLFDTTAGPRATKATFGSDRLSVPAGRYVRVAEAEIGPGIAEGELSTEALTARWSLRFSDRHEPLRHLPSDRMYEAPIPRTKLLSPHPGTSFEGSLTVDGEEIALAGWPGMIGHNWGAEHAERWIWMHGAAFEGGSDGDWLDVGAGRVKLGPLQTPWIANGMLVLDGERHRLGGIGKVRRTSVDARAGHCEFVLPGRGLTVSGSVSAAKEHFVGWIYADPDGGEHNTINCSVSDLQIRVDRPGSEPRLLRVARGAAYELGMRESDHGIEIQPYPDG